MKKIFSHKKQLMIFALIVVLVSAAGAGGYFFREYRLSAQSPATADQASNAKTIAQVASLVEVPADETPTVALVADREKLKDQPFFASAQNGDMVLIYASNKKVILYRPSTDKIVDIAPVNVGASPTPASTPVTIALRNGTSIVGLAKVFQDVIKVKSPEVTIVDLDNASKRDYEKSVIVDLTGTKLEAVNALASALGLTVSALPAGESTASADFLIIVGLDKRTSPAPTP